MLLKNKSPEVTCLVRRELLSRMLATGLASTAAGTFGSLGVGSAYAVHPTNMLLDEWVDDLHGIGEHASRSTSSFSHTILPNHEREIANVLYRAETQQRTWDVYMGMIPFVDMNHLINNNVIEPWDSYMPGEVLDDIVPAIRNECSVDGNLYCWPFLLDVTGIGWNAGITNSAGLPDQPPSTWDAYLESAATIAETQTDRYGATFDAHGWRSLAPIAHSFSPNTYTEHGLFDFTSTAAIEALKLMKQIRRLSHPDLLQPGASQPGITGTPDEVAFAAEKVGLYTKYLNAPMRMAQYWDTPTNLGIGPIPRGSENDGSTLFWTTGVALLKNGKNKESAAEYIKELTYDRDIWRHSLAGPENSGPGQLPPYKSIYANWRQQSPHWLPDFVMPIHQELDRASSIPSHPLALQQFVIGQPIWEKYLDGSIDHPELVLREVTDAVTSHR